MENIINVKHPREYEEDEDEYCHHTDESKENVELPHHELVPEEEPIDREALDNEEFFNQGVVSRQYVDWSHRTVGIRQTWERHRVTGRGVTVAVLDTGADKNHPDLVVSEGRDFTGSRVGWHDVQGHGTHVSGIVGAKNNGIGTVGAAPDCKIIACKVLGDRGTGSYDWIASGISWAVSRGANVINMSLGGSGPIAMSVRRQIDNAIARGVIVCVAAGNSGPSEGTVGAPGNYSRCVTVGATDSRNAPARFSSRGKTVDIAAPGVDIMSLYPGKRLAKLSGTSMATPLVSGVAALFVQKCASLGVKPNQGLFEKLAVSTALDIGPRGKDTATGYGLIRPTVILEQVERIAACKRPKRLVPDREPCERSTTVKLVLSDGRVVTFDNVVSFESKLN